MKEFLKSPEGIDVVVRLANADVQVTNPSHESHLYGKVEPHLMLLLVEKNIFLLLLPAMLHYCHVKQVEPSLQDKLLKSSYSSTMALIDNHRVIHLLAKSPEGNPHFLQHVFTQPDIKRYEPVLQRSIRDYPKPWKQIVDLLFTRHKAFELESLMTLAPCLQSYLKQKMESIQVTAVDTVFGLWLKSHDVSPCVEVSPYETEFVNKLIRTRSKSQKPIEPTAKKQKTLVQ